MTIGRRCIVWPSGARAFVEAFERRVLLSGYLIPVTNHRDLVFDSARQELDITTSAGTLQRFSVATQSLLSPLTVGTSLNGADITPDGSTLVVAENSSPEIHIVNLNTGAVTNDVYSPGFDEGNAWDVSVVSNTQAFFTTQFSGSGWTPLRQINLTTNTITTRADDPGSGPSHEVEGSTEMARSSDRSLAFFAEPNNSAGPTFTYSTASNIFPSSKWFDYFFGGSTSPVPAVNRNGSLIAVPESLQSTYIVDSSFNAVKTITQNSAGVIFNPQQDVLYAVNSNAGQIVAYDTNTWAVKYQLAIGENVISSGPLGNGTMAISGDGNWLFLATASGVREFYVGSAPQAFAGGPYSVYEGGITSLTGLAFASPTGSVASYQWDLNYDGSNFIPTMAASTATFSAANLFSPITRTVALQVTDSLGQSAISTATVTVNPVIPAVQISGPPLSAAGSVYPLSLSATTPAGPDAVSSWTVTWGDGSAPQVVSGDPSVVTHVFANSGSDTITAMATDANGTYSAGNVNVGLDSSFGNKGNVTLSIEAESSDSYPPIAVQPDGKIVVAGEYGFGWQIERLNADGTLDTTFGTSGVVDIALNTSANLDARPHAIAIQSDGKIIVGGMSEPTNSFWWWTLIRLNTNGTLDTTFGTNGAILRVSQDENAAIYALAVRSNGRIIAAGFDNGGFAVMQYLANGSLDTSFNGTGVQNVTFGSTSYESVRGMALQPDGKVVVIGTTRSGMAGLARINPDGSMDSGFGSAGQLTVNVGGAISLAVQSDGKIDLGGNNGAAWVAVRLDPDGSFDQSYATNGEQVIAFSGATAASVSATLIQPNGKLVLAGSVTIPGSLAFYAAVARVNPDGTLDTSFNGTGSFVTVETTFATLHSAALQPDGKIDAVIGYYTNLSVGRFDAGSLSVKVNNAATSFAGSTFYVKADVNPQDVDVWTNSTGAGSPAMQLIKSSLNGLTVTGTGASESLTLDYSAGTLGTMPILYDGGGGVDTLEVVGTSGSDNVGYNGSWMTFNYAPIAFANMQNVVLVPGSGSASVAVNLGKLTIAAPAAGAGIVPRNFSVLSTVRFASLVFADAASHADHSIITTSNLYVVGALDLGDNDMIVSGAAASGLATILSDLQSGFASGSWNGSGIISSAAIGSNDYALGAILNADNSGNAIYGAGPDGPFDGQSPASSAVLIKFTYFGDADLSGSITAAAYALIDNGFNDGGTLSGWYNGDFNYDGVINGDDYTLIDNAFNSQASVQNNAAAMPQAHIAPAVANAVSIQTSETVDDLKDCKDLSIWSRYFADGDSVDLLN